MDQSSEEVGEGGRVLKAEERITSREETVGATKEDMVWGEGMLAGRVVRGNEEGTGPERGQMERWAPRACPAPLGSLDSGGHGRVLRMRH